MYQRFEKLVFRHDVRPEEVAAIFVEPVQGEGGYIVPPPEYLPMLRNFAENMAFCSSPTKSRPALAALGKMFACEHWDIEPDVLCTAKGIASGMPLGAMIAREEISTWKDGTHGSTYGGNPVACAAALATIELLEGGLVANSAKVGAVLKDRLTQLKQRYAVIGDVRGLGLMIGVDFERSDGSHAPDDKFRDGVMQRCFESGLLLLSCGQSTCVFVHR